MGFSELSYCANITFLRHFYIVGSAFSSTFFEWLYRVSTCGIDREIEWFVVFSAFWVFLGATRVKFTCPNYYGIGCNRYRVKTVFWDMRAMNSPLRFSRFMTLRVAEVCAGCYCSLFRPF